MGLPAIRFSHIRPLDGSQHTAFEEVCCQLAAEEQCALDSEFVRKGRGADGGVECLRYHPDGSQHGWQAKYVFAWSDSLAAQLTDSIETALRTHPRLTRYTVCLPFDLPDGRPARGNSARQKWEEWRRRWMVHAKTEGRSLSIELWGQSQLIAGLTADADRMAGRVLYWFEEYAFSPAFFSSSFDVARAALGSRYTPETNVVLPIRRDFLALVRDRALQDEVDQWFVRVGDAGTTAAREVDRLECGDEAGHVSRLRGAVQSTVDSLSQNPIKPSGRFPVREWLAAIETCTDVAYTTIRWLYALKVSPPTDSRTRADAKSTAVHYLRELLDALGDVREALGSRRWALVNERAVLLIGQAGIGKSHLLADVVQHQVEQGLPALLIPSSQLNDAEPWRQILNELHRPSTEEVRHFLGALDAAAQAKGARALICIDALNERHGIRFWPYRLSAFLAAAAPYLHVAIVVSCRTTYVPHVVPKELIGSQLHAIEHEGFADDATGTAAEAYLEIRGVIRPGAPSLLPEFNNPLFLKTCCDLLDGQGVREFPRGLRGVTSIFTFYFDAVTDAINNRLQLDPHFGFVPKAIAAFVDLLVDTTGGYIAKSAAIELFERVRPSGGSLENSLLSQLASEGLLSIEPVADDAGRSTEHVRFTFERYSDYAAAYRALDRWLDASDLKGSFVLDKPLGNMAFGEDNYMRAGVIEALSVLLPERLGHELIDLTANPDFTAVDAFRHSLLWREQRHFTNRTYELLAEHWDKDIVDDLLISISTEPDNPYNARFIDRSLRALTLPERDAAWSTYLARRGFDGEIQTLISWALAAGEHPIDPERAELAALVLTWFLTTPHRLVRDRATKGLAALLSDRLDLAAAVLSRFSDVDDPYVIERLLAACYGAAMQGNSHHLMALAETVDRVVFDGSPVLVDVLARDHALGILEYAASRSLLPASVDLDSCRPPYTSPWPLELVSDELIATYVEKHTSGSFNDQIVSSTINDGDFARYIMDGCVDDWSPASIDVVRLPTAWDQYREWEEAFLAAATPLQRTALTRLLAAADAVEGQGGYQQSPEMDMWKAALVSFRELVSSYEWERFRVTAQSFIRFGRRNEWAQSRPATFDTGWARRWVCKRAHDLGWTSELFSEFERSYVEYGRTEHRIERVGKKYQWIAFRELLARMADNLAYIGPFHGRDEWAPGTYERAQQAGVRDIDPSLLMTTTYYDDWAQWPPTWWSPMSPNLRAASLRDRVAWLESPKDVLTGPSLIDVLEPKSGRRWLVLSAFARRSNTGLVGGQREMQRSTWYRLRCVVVHQKDFAALLKAFRGKTMVDLDSFEGQQLGHAVYLGEFPWHPELADQDAWFSRGPRHTSPRSAKLTTVEYRCEAGQFDQSLDRTIALELPAPWLAKALALRMVSGKRPQFIDAMGNVLFFDPSAIHAGPAAALVDRIAFLDMLRRDGLAAFWVISGEKDVSAGSMHRQELVGRYSHTQSFWLEDEWKMSTRQEEWYRMNEPELANLLGEAEESGDNVA